ncbi:MAG: hypothetical protein WCX48_09675 [Bacteroidales bacterium]
MEYNSKTPDLSTHDIPPEDDFGYISIPIALLNYNSTMLYNSYLILENQLSQIDPECEPGIYTKLNDFTQRIFDSWVLLGSEGGEDNGIGV